MPHQVHQRKFGRTTGQRRTMLKNLTLSVLRYERVKTTEAKAKEIRGFVDRMINLGKDGSLVARRRARAWLPEQVIVEKVFDDLAKRYPDRTSGYLRTTHLARRVGDSAPLMLLELMPATEEKKPEADADAAPKRRRLGLPRRRAAAETTKADKAESAPAKAKRAPARKKTTAGAKEA
ncbi:MAG: 50S ribosomal protein L17 [Chloroflexota bacterium]